MLQLPPESFYATFMHLLAVLHVRYATSDVAGNEVSVAMEVDLLDYRLYSNHVSFWSVQSPYHCTFSEWLSCA